MTGCGFTVTCPTCGGELTFVTSGKPSPSGTDTRAIVCCKHHGEWLVCVWMAPVATPLGIAPVRSQCGTDNGYQAHIRAAEEPCDRCSDAHAYRNKTLKRLRRERARELQEA